MNRLKFKLVTGLIFILLVLVIILSLSLGSGGFILFNKLNYADKVILNKIRIPRMLLALSVGGALSVSGLVLQTLFHNQLVEPYTLGISAGSLLFISFALYFDLVNKFGFLTLPFISFLGALAVIYLLIIWSKKSIKLESLLLKGVMLNFIASSLFMLIMALSKNSNLQKIIYWTMGSLTQTESILILFSLISSILGIIIYYFFAIDLNGILIGDEEAISLGIEVEKVKRILFFTTSFLIAISVSVAGIIGFVGLVVPHFLKIILGYDHRILLINSFLAGSLFLLLCDTIARTIIMPIELPVGTITGIIGGFLFIYILSKREKI